MTNAHQSYQTAAQHIVEQVGNDIVLGVPLGIGKPIGVINALYQLALNNSKIQLTIITGLTLARPSFKNELERNFIVPILERILKDYEDPLYEKDRLSQNCPKNIKIIEFFLTPGKYIYNQYVQQNYISSTYTNVVRDVIYRSINVIAQQVAHSKENPKQYSLSCNTDLFHETKNYLMQAQHTCGKKIAIVAEVNQHLPFMLGDDAIVEADIFTDIVDVGKYRALFALPREELAPEDHLIGLYTSSLIEDGGCLQIGIGKHSQSVANALIMRDQNNALYCDLMKKLNIEKKFSNTHFYLDPFHEGIYGSTEMFSDEYLQLYLAKILRKKVYDHEGLQRLLNEKIINELVTVKTLDQLLKQNIIQAKLTKNDVDFLKKYGIFAAEIAFENEFIILKNGEKIPADLLNTIAKQKIEAYCLGKYLKLGSVLHAGFFLGSVDFYQQLKQLSPHELSLIAMTKIARTNTLNWSYKLAELQRQRARMINYAMMITLSGFVVSDGVKNLQEISGVGGQFDFVIMSQQLPNARSMISCRSTRKNKNGLESNILWDYPNTTIPRYLRDIIITEYGIADCRSKTDSEIIQAILNITDSRFQENLLKKAKKYGKVPSNYEINKEFQNNYPESFSHLICDLQKKGYCKPYPFGSDLTRDEQVLAKVLLYLKNSSKIKMIYITLCAILYCKKANQWTVYLERMQLNHPKTIKQLIYKKILKYILATKIVN